MTWPRSAGLDLINVSGGPAKDFIVDANGNGAAFFDYDRDGDLDALIVNGSTRERMAFNGRAAERHSATTTTTATSTCS